MTKRLAAITMLAAAAAAVLACLATPARAGGLTRQQLEAHGWTCLPILPANRYSCFNPGLGRPFPGNPDPRPSYTLVTFDISSGEFIYTGHLIRQDLYHGQPCAPGGTPTTSARSRLLRMRPRVGAALAAPRYLRARRRRVPRGSLPAPAQHPRPDFVARRPTRTRARAPRPSAGLPCRGRRSSPARRPARSRALAAAWRCPSRPIPVRNAGLSKRVSNAATRPCPCGRSSSQSRTPASSLPPWSTAALRLRSLGSRGRGSALRPPAGRPRPPRSGSRR